MIFELVMFIISLLLVVAFIATIIYIIKGVLKLIINIFDGDDKNTVTYIYTNPNPNPYPNPYPNVSPLTVKSDWDVIDFTLVQTLSECREACKKIKNDCAIFSAVGFDCEWVSWRVRYPVALVQLATYNKKCYLFRLNKLGLIPNDLKEILEDSNIIKLGVLPARDGSYLSEDYGTKVSTTLDLRYLYPECKGLGDLAKTVLGIVLDKGERTGGSNWESYELSNSQKIYAAKDALVAIDIFQVYLLENGNADFLSCKKFNYFEFVTFLAYLNKYDYINQDPPQNKVSSKKICESVDFENKTIAKAKEKEKTYTTPLLKKTPFYDKCYMYAPDGELLCSCDLKKAMWYVNRELAQITYLHPDSNNITIQLLFEPAGRANTKEEEKYYTQLKQNCCVVCGYNTSYLRHHVVPREYRKHFPSKMKRHVSHDILLLCIECHEIAVGYGNILKKKLSIICKAPIHNANSQSRKSLVKIKNYARALLYNGANISNQRKTIMKNEILNYFGESKVTLNLLKYVSAIKIKTPIEESHGFKVVEYFLQYSNGLVFFIYYWRDHFIRKMTPGYLPAFWSVLHNFSDKELTFKDNLKIIRINKFLNEQ